MGQNTARRSASRFKHERKRAKKRIDIKAGRALSMQQLMHNTHNHEEIMVAEPEVVTAEEAMQSMQTQVAVILEDQLVNGPGDYVLVRKHHKVVDGVQKTIEAEIERGTEYNLRKMRANLMAAEHEDSDTIYSVRKVKA